jgi:hypothetical protein
MEDLFPTRFLAKACERSFSNGETKYYFGLYELPNLEAYLEREWKKVMRQREMEGFFDGRWNREYEAVHVPKHTEDTRDYKRRKVPEKKGTKQSF